MTGIELCRLVTAQKKANDQLKDKGWISLNEAFDLLDLPRPQDPHENLLCDRIGWIIDNK